MVSFVIRFLALCSLKVFFENEECGKMKFFTCFCVFIHGIFTWKEKKCKFAFSIKRGVAQ